MAYRLAVDLGTTNVVATVAVDGSPVDVLVLGSPGPYVSSSVFVADDALVVGDEAASRGAVDPGRLLSDPRGGLGRDQPSVVGGQEVSAEQATAAVLTFVRDRAVQRFGAPPAETVLTFPVRWNEYQQACFDRAVAEADLGPTVLCSEAQAAAATFDAREPLAPADRFAVVDLGGGSCEVTVLTRAADGFDVTGAPEGGEHPSGADVDEAVYRLVLGSLGERGRGLQPDDPPTRDLLAGLRRRCVVAKEVLSEATEAEVAVSLPDFSSSVRLTRTEVESLVRPTLRGAVTMVTRVLRTAGTAAGDLTAIVLVGGCCRMPLVAELLQREFRTRLAIGARPELDVAVGALLRSGSGRGVVAPQLAGAAQPGRPGDEAAGDAPDAPSAAAAPATAPVSAAGTAAETPAAVVAAAVAPVAVTTAAVGVPMDSASPVEAAADGEDLAPTVADDRPAATTPPAPIGAVPTPPPDTDPTEEIPVVPPVALLDQPAAPSEPVADDPYRDHRSDNPVPGFGDDEWDDDPEQGYPEQGYPEQGYAQQGHAQQGHAQQGHAAAGLPGAGLPRSGPTGAAGLGPGVRSGTDPGDVDDDGGRAGAAAQPGDGPDWVAADQRGQSASARLPTAAGTRAPGRAPAGTAGPAPTGPRRASRLPARTAGHPALRHPWAGRSGGIPAGARRDGLGWTVRLPRPGDRHHRGGRGAGRRDHRRRLLVHPAQGVGDRDAVGPRVASSADERTAGHPHPQWLTVGHPVPRCERRPHPGQQQPGRHTIDPAGCQGAAGRRRHPAERGGGSDAARGRGRAHPVPGRHRGQGRAHGPAVAVRQQREPDDAARPYLGRLPQRGRAPGDGVRRVGRPQAVRP